MSNLTVALISIVATLFVVLLVSNLSSGEKKVQHEIEPLYPIASEQFRRVLSSLLGPPIAPGNRIQPLQNGDEIFPAMLEAVRTAERTIDFLTFVYWKGVVAREFAQALAERARAGVDVRVLIDAVGGRPHRGTLEMPTRLVIRASTLPD